MLIGGGLSDGERMASDIDVFIRPDQAVELCRGVAQVFGELGNRENRGLARMRYLAQELGPEGFRAALDERTNFPLPPAGRELTTAFRGDHVGVHPQKQPGLFYVGCSVPVGRMHGMDLVELARLAETYGDGGVRIGTDQNFIVSGVPEARLDDLLAEPLMQTYSPFPGPFERGVVACTGSEFCRFAVVETKERAVKWARALDAQLSSDGEGQARPDDAGVIRMHFSGCSASCAQPQIADIGFRGDIAHVDEHIEEAVDIGLGGSLGPDAAFIDWVVGAVPVDRGARRPRSGSSPATARSTVPVSRSISGHGAPPPTICGRRLTRRGRGGDAVKRYRLREQMNGITEPPGKVWFWELEAGVIHADRCIQCGTCVAVCPSNSIGVDEDTNLPELVKMCTGCSLCWDFCPRGGLRYEALWPPSTVAADEDAEVAAGPGPLGLVGHVLEDQRRPAGRRARCRRGLLRRAGQRADRRRAGRRRGQRSAHRAAGGGRDRRRPRVQAESPIPTSSGRASPPSRRRPTRSGPPRAASTTRRWRWPSWICRGTTCRPSRASRSSARRARCRVCGRCRRAAGPPARTGSMRSC